MNFILDSYYMNIGINLSSSMLALLTLLMLIIGYHNEFKGNGYVIFIAAVNLIFNMNYLAEAVWLEETGTFAHILLNLFYLGRFTLPYVLLFAMIMYTIHIIEENGAKVPGQSVAKLAFILAILPFLINLYSPFIYYIDKVNKEIIYLNRYGFLLTQVMDFLLVLYLLIILEHHHDKLSKNQIRVILLFIGAPLLAVLIFMSTEKMDLVPLFTTFSVFLMGLTAQNEQLLKFYQHEEELDKMKVTLLISQLRPHFLYNALSSISQLCKINPMQASLMTDRFSEFLSKNMRDLQKTEPIRFEKELEYIENYIAIEKMRFGEDLEVIYEIETVDFMIPPLVVQPILENSIKHGLGGKEEGGMIRIATRKVGNCTILTISDDGVGYDPKRVIPKDDGRIHVGVASVQRRFQEIPGAHYLVKSIIGQGTSITVIIPDSYNEAYTHNKAD